MGAAVNYVGRRSGRWFFVPGTMRERFRAAGGRTARQATPEETAAALALGKGARNITPLSQLAATAVPAVTEAGTAPSTGRYNLDEVRARVAKGESIAAVARDLGVHKSTLSRALKEG